MLKVYIGWDPREDLAYQVALASLVRRATGKVCVTRLELERNEHWGLIKRPREVRSGRMWDVVSDAPMATEFACSRFLVPMLAQEGWALFVDSDVVFLDDIAKILAHADPSKAVMVVQHDYQPAHKKKMDGQIQTSYARKNWSSAALYHASHPANRRLSLGNINKLPGRDLHRFCWLRDDEIGALPTEFNWLVGEQPKPENPVVAHFTLGTPDLLGHTNGPHADIWVNEAKELGLWK